MSGSGGNQNHKKANRLIPIAVVLLIILAFALIKLTGGKNETPEEGTPTGNLPLISLSESDAPGSVAAVLKEIPDFDGTHYVITVNDNEPLFARDEMEEEFYTKLSDLDALGRAGAAEMCADEAHIQTGERSSIRDLKPSGWHGGGFYERSHLLMWKLTGINQIENLVTGTATFNEKNMQDYEKKVTRYLWDHEKNHVMYRVTPLFKGQELVCRGVLMEAWSVEDEGALSYCVFVYNAEPDAMIDYETGDYMENAENMTKEREEK